MKWASLILLLATGGGACKKEPQQPVVYSDYFTANVNGKYWKAGCDHMFNNCMRVRYDSTRNIFSVDGTDNNSRNIILVLADSNTVNTSTGEFTLVGYTTNLGHSGNFATYQDPKRSYRYSYYTDSTYMGTMTVTFDKQNKRVRGYFSFKAKFESDSDEVNVTGGRFSLSFP